MENEQNCSCAPSTNIVEIINFGHGKLDFNGFWEFPCTHGKRDLVWDEETKSLKEAASQ